MALDRARSPAASLSRFVDPAQRAPVRSRASSHAPRRRGRM